jgi:phage-related protein (TIGR01555 family)
VSLIQSAVRRLDAWINYTTGFGVEGSGENSNYVGQDRVLTEVELDRLYRTSWLGKRIIQEFPKHALADGFVATPGVATPAKTPTSEDALQASQDQAMQRFEELNFSDRVPEGYLLRTQYLARVHGGAALLLGLDSDPRTAWSPDVEDDSAAVIGGEILWLDCASWRQLAIKEYNEDRNSPDYKSPILFEIQGSHPRAGEVFHASRMIFFEGEPHLGTPTDLTQDPFWSDSVFFSVQKAIARYDLSIAGLGHAISKMDLMKVKMEGLFETMSSQNGEDWAARQRIFSKGLSSHRTIWLDTNEDADRMPFQMAGVEKGLEWILLDVCGAAKTPAVKLFGRSPAGLNSSGESDLEMFDQEKRAYQQLQLKPKLELIFHAIAGQPYQIQFPDDSQVQQASEVDQQAAAAAGAVAETLQNSA